jgi:ankyrin repeat protein
LQVHEFKGDKYKIGNILEIPVKLSHIDSFYLAMYGHTELIKARGHIKYCFTGACRGGHIKIVKTFRNLSVATLNKGMLNASLSGHMDVVTYLIDCGATCLGEGFNRACRSGNLDLVKLFIDEGAKCIDDGFVHACETGCVNIVVYLMSVGVTDLGRGFEKACRYGHKVIIKILLCAGVNVFDEGLDSACKGGFIEIAKQMVSLGAQVTYKSLSCAYGSGCVDLILFIREFINPEYINPTLLEDLALYEACRNGKLEVAKTMIRLGATGLEFGIRRLIRSLGEDTAKLLYKCVDYNSDMDRSRMDEYEKLAVYLVEAGCLDWNNYADMNLREWDVINVLSTACTFKFRVLTSICIKMHVNLIRELLRLDRIKHSDDCGCGIFGLV